MAKVALLIGISEYEPGLNPLPGAVKDVEAMRRVLTHPEMGGFAQTDITVLKNPLRQEMEDAIYQLFANRQKDDLLLFYFSGHGVKDESGKLYLSTRVTRKDKGRLVKPSAVAASFLHESINESKSQRQVIILDCCFSGAIAQGLTVKDDDTVDIQTQLGGKGRAILTSSTSTQYSFEQEGAELSIYTRYLVEGIEKGAADLDGDGWIGLDELHEYASSKVQEAAPAMTPKFYPVEEGYRIRLAKAPVDDPKLKYRKEVEGIAREHEGEISSINRSYLDELRNTLKLLSEEADAIESEVLEPYRQHWAKLQRYEQVFTEAIGQEYPLSERNRNGLKRLQQALKLRDEDVLRVEGKIIRQRRKFPIPQLLTRQQFLKLAGLGGAGFVVTIVVRGFQGNSPQPKPSHSPSQKATPNELSLKEFNFDVVTVGARGKETKRSSKQAKFFTEDLGNGIGLHMVSISGGKFLMGSSEGEPEKYKEFESPQHTVTIQPFFIGKFPVTQAQWKAVASLPTVEIDLDLDPSNFKGAKRPVEKVTWNDVVEFCARLSKATGRQYRLPSEAEWEYACRAGTTTPFHFGETITTDLVNYNGNDIYASGSTGIYRTQTTEVGSFPANAFGLYDMHGNVWEWCEDTWHDNYKGAPTDGSSWINQGDNQPRLLRGGSWYNEPRDCRSASRIGMEGDYFNNNKGFRVVCAAARTP